MVLQEVGNNMKKISLNLGCGIYLIGGFINVDKFYTLKQLKEKKGDMCNTVIEKGAKFVQADMCALPFRDNYADYIETMDAVEHITFKKLIPVFSEMYRVLKSGGKLVIVTTNFDQLAELWTEKIAGKSLDNDKIMKDYLDLMEVIYGNQNHPGEFHTVPFNPYFLGFLLQKVGFKKKDIKMRVYPMGSKCPSRKILKASRFSSNNRKIKWVARTDMILVQAKK